MFFSPKQRLPRWSKTSAARSNICARRQSTRPRKCGCDRSCGLAEADIFRRQVAHIDAAQHALAERHHVKTCRYRRAAAIADLVELQHRHLVVLGVTPKQAMAAIGNLWHPDFIPGLHDKTCERRGARR